MTEVAPACQRCLQAHRDGVIWHDMVMPLPPHPPTAKDGSGPCCRDCVSAETIMRVIGLMDWNMARVAIGNNRIEGERLPGVAIGLAYAGFMQPSEPGDLEAHLDWLDAIGLSYDGMEQ